MESPIESKESRLFPRQQFKNAVNASKRLSGKKKNKRSISKYTQDLNHDNSDERNIEMNTISNKYSQTSDKVGSNIKSSLSMTSLDATDKVDSRKVLKAKLKIERPYNSLKKCTNTVNSKCKYDNLNRFSWGSMNSYSSSSLHSGTTLGLSSCKDDLWSAIQTNYNYIMDTNLLDSCKEARCEIEGEPQVLESPVKYYSKMLQDSNPSYDLYGDLKELRTWLLQMEQKLENAPTVSEATFFTIHELQRLLKEHSVLYHEIVSHARVVSSCIRAATEKGMQDMRDIKICEQDFQNAIDTNSLLPTLPDDCTISSTVTTQSISSGIGTFLDCENMLSETSSVTRNVDEPKNEENFEQLQNRYHLLYLKAFEVQLCLDGLLRKKTSQVNTDDVDEVAETTLNGEISAKCCCGATDDDVNINSSDLNSISSKSDSENKGNACISSNFNINRVFVVPQFYKEDKAEYEDGDDEEEPHDTLLNITYANDEFAFENHINKMKKKSQSVLNNFDADSEGSDNDNPNNILRVLKKHSNRFQKSKRFVKERDLVDGKAKSKKRFGGKITLKMHLNSNDFGKSKETANTILQNSTATTSENQPLSIESRCKKSMKKSVSSIKKQIFFANPIMKPYKNEVPNNLVNRSHSKQKQQSIDISKFNRSNRKSKNCAIFYFKHTDTENEINSDCNGVDMNLGALISSADNSKSQLNTQNNYFSCSDHLMKETDNMQSSSPQNINLCNLPRPISSSKSINSNSSSSSTTLSQNKSQISHESIKQLVLQAENLLREEVLKPDIKPNHSIVKLSATIKKYYSEMSGPLKTRVEEWLEHQPLSLSEEQKMNDMQNNTRTVDDCEASGEISDSSSILEHDCDSSEVFSDSIATCMQTSTNSYENSNELIGDSEPLTTSINACEKSYKSLNINVTKCRKAERPWSVSCLSQLTTGTIEASVNETSACEVHGHLASHSMSESALDSLSTRIRKQNNVNSSAVPLTINDSKSSIKRRKIRKKKLSYEKRSESDSANVEEIAQQIMCAKSTESMSAQHLKKQNLYETSKRIPKRFESEDEQELMKPNFRVGLLTTAYITDTRTSLGTSVYHHDMQCENTIVTEDHHSSFSETAWDNYQEKYNSENYSEGFDSDAARRLMEFGDDYRNFIDSQSDCCSSVSAANNVDSFSPSHVDSLQSSENKVLFQGNLVDNVNRVRKQHDSKSEIVKIWKTSKGRRKSYQESNEVELQYYKKILNCSRKITQDKYNGQMQRKTSESDNSSRRRKSVDERRRSSRNLEKVIKQFPSSTTSSNYNDSDDERELLHLLQQSRDNLDGTNSLKIRCHLLRPADYNDIINTCRDNISCLETVLTGTSSTVLPTKYLNKTKDLLADWEDLLRWSLNFEIACNLQEELVVLKQKINQLGIKPQFVLLETEATIVLAVETLKDERVQLQSYRKIMLRINSSVYTWLSRRNCKFDILEKHQLNDTGTGIINELQIEKFKSEKDVNNLYGQDITQQTSEKQIGHDMDFKRISLVIKDVNDIYLSTSKWILSENMLHSNLKNCISETYVAWDEANSRINEQLETLSTSLNTWRQLESGLSEFHQTLGLDRGTLKGIEVILDKGQTTPDEIAQNVQVVVKLLSENINLSKEQITAAKDILDPNHIIHIAHYTASNGSLSDSGISDGGTTSDGGLSERERRLGTLRRLAKQLENNLAPGSEAVKSIAARIELAETELKFLQNSCRDLILRTAETRQYKKKYPTKCFDVQNQFKTKSCENTESVFQNESNSNKKIFYKKNFKIIVDNKAKLPQTNSEDLSSRRVQGTSLNQHCESADDNLPCRRSWAWRVAKAALPMQLALITFLCAACVMQPNCCDNVNNFSMSFATHLRYIRGPPPL